MKKFNLLAVLLITALELVACNSGGGDPNNVPKQNNLPQVACSASFGGGWESSGTISYNPPLSPQNLGYINQYIYFDNRPSRVSYLDATYADSSGYWNGQGSIVKPVPVYGIEGGTSVQNNQYSPSQLPADVCTYMYSVEESSSNNGVVPNTVNHGVMAWKNCSASITNGVMTFYANYEFYLNSLNTVPVESGTVTFTCNNINNIQPPKPLPQTSTSSKIAQTINGYGSNFAKYIDSLRNTPTQN
ncbi:MAG TPA: hypothetical protein PLP75_13515 [Burkholderiales bacterium]|nr:hypothetical protein [Burkholderiales bacterium]